MKRSLIPAVVLLCYSTLFLSCEKDENPIVTFLSVDLSRAEEGKWIFATNEKGELLDLVRVGATNRSLQLFQTNKKFRTIDLTFFRAEPDYNGNLWYYATTYRNVPSTQSVDAGFPSLGDFGQTSLIGSMHLTIKNYPGALEDLRVVTKRGQVSPGEIALSTNTVTANFEVLENSRWVIVSGMRQGVPVYYRRDLTAGDATVEVDFNSFLSMENIQTVTLAGSASISGIAESGYLMPVSFILKNNSDGSTPMKLGTVPGFPRYLSWISGIGQSYRKVGAAIPASESVESKFISYSLDVTDRNLATFAMNFSADYDYKVAGSSTQDVAPVIGNWFVYADADDDARIVFDLPEEILNSFPAIRDHQLPAGSVSVYKSSNNSYSYTDFLNAELEFNYKAEFEQLVFSK